MKSTSIYLDYAAATPMDKAAIRAMQPYFAERFFNPSAVYQPARMVRKELEDARATVADVLGAKDQEIIFTAGGTEANNIAIHGVLSQFKHEPRVNIVVSAIEHESVLEPAKSYEYRVAPVKPNGILDVQALTDLIDDHTVMISIMYANNEVGTVQPLKEVVELVAKKRQQRTNNLPLYVHTDACQAANYLDLQVARLGVDLMTINGGKIYASKQSGALYVRSTVQIDNVIEGGGQERGIRSGTENVPSCIAFATMLQMVQADRKIQTETQRELTHFLFAKLSQNIPELILNGDSKKRLPNNLNLQLPGADGERLLMELDQAGVLVATGSACTASNDEPSHVLKAMGLTDAEASASIRITIGRYTNEKEIESAAKVLIKTMQQHLRLV